MLSCTIFSECESKALVASSKIRIGAFLTSARAMATRCLWPPLNELIFTVSCQTSVFDGVRGALESAESLDLTTTLSIILSNFSSVQPRFFKSPCNTILVRAMGVPATKLGEPSTKSTWAILMARLTSSGVASKFP
mmetsp:Transcript_53743/g.143810  ORF Transcript_53743/g.143810 Transcript_53743/m.143810 type:complete len:136 (+) Transcript_53743:399-806(+)